MKQLFLGIALLGTIVLQAQQNTLLDPGFWRNNPDLSTVKAEIEKGNNPAELNRSSFDPVVYAINGKASNEVIKYMLTQKGNDVNKITHDSRTYIFWAASQGNVEIVQYLIDKGADISVEDSHGTTPIGFAANAGQSNPKLYEALTKAGASIKQKNKDGASLLLTGISGDKDGSLTNYLISKGLSLKDTDNDGNTAFNYVARTGNIDALKGLIAKGVKFTDNALLMAAQGTRNGAASGLHLYEYLESLGIKATAVNKNGENILHILARKPNQLSIVQHFLKKGVNANQKDAEGNTPLMNAASANKDLELISLLVQESKDVNAVNNKGVSALAQAIKSNSAEVVQKLIAAGAKVNTVDADGNNLAWYLIQSYTGTQTGPRGAGGSQNAADPFLAKMKLLQDAGLDITSTQKDGSTLLHLAVAKNDVSLLKKLEKLNIDINAKNKEGLTSLQKAAMIAKDDSVLKYLLSIGAKKDIATEFEETAYDMAKENEYLTKNNISVEFLK